MIGVTFPPLLASLHALSFYVAAGITSFGWALCHFAGWDATPWLPLWFSAAVLVYNMDRLWADPADAWNLPQRTAASARLRVVSAVLTVCAALVLIVSAGFVSLGPSQEHGEAGGGGGYVPPKGPAVATVEIDALPQLKFQSKDFPTQAGVNEIKYIDKGGTHTLLFAETELAGFKLQVPPDDSGKVDLKPGTYTVFCDIPGHRAAGMEATITVK